MTWKKVALRKDVRPGAPRVVKVAGREIVLYDLEGELCAIDNVCPHRLGPLSEGFLENGIVSCPWHGWRFDVRTGEGVSHRMAKVDRFPVELRGEEIFLGIE